MTSFEEFRWTLNRYLREGDNVTLYPYGEIRHYSDGGHWVTYRLMLECDRKAFPPERVAVVRSMEPGMKVPDPMRDILFTGWVGPLMDIERKAQEILKSLRENFPGVTITIAHAR